MEADTRIAEEGKVQRTPFRSPSPMSPAQWAARLSPANGAATTNVYPPHRYCLFMVCHSVSDSPPLQSASGTASASPCGATSSSLPSPSLSQSSSSPLQPSCWRCRAGKSGNAAATDGPDAGTKGRTRLTQIDTRPDSCRARHCGRRATSRPPRKRCQHVHHPAAASTSIPRRCVRKLGTFFMCSIMRSERDKCTNRDTKSFTWSKNLDCIVDTRWTSQLAWRCNQPGPRSRHNSPSAFMLAASLTLGSCSHGPLGTHDTPRSAFSGISEVRDYNSCTCVNGCPATAKNLVACPASGLVLSTCVNLDLEQLGAANIGITNFSRSIGHETASSSERARGLRRLLQRMLEVQSIICRANSHRGLVVRGSSQEENRCQVAPQRERLEAMAEGTMVKNDANESFTGHVNDVGEKTCGTSWYGDSLCTVS